MAMSEDSPTKILEQISQTAGGAFRFGTGVMGKSAVLLFLLLSILGLAIWRLASVAALVGLALVAVASFFVWFFAMLHHSHKYPETALLEGAEWTAWKRFEATSKLEHGPRPQLPGPDPEVGKLPPPSEAEIEEPDHG